MFHDPASEPGDLLGEAPRLLVSKVASVQWHSYSANSTVTARHSYSAFSPGTITAPGMDTITASRAP